MPHELVIDHDALAALGAGLVGARRQFDRDHRNCRDPLATFGTEALAAAYLEAMRVHDDMLRWASEETESLARLADETLVALGAVDDQLAAAHSVHA